MRRFVRFKGLLNIESPATVESQKLTPMFVDLCQVEAFYKTTAGYNEDTVYAVCLEMKSGNSTVIIATMTEFMAVWESYFDKPDEYHKNELTYRKDD